MDTNLAFSELQKSMCKNSSTIVHIWPQTARLFCTHRVKCVDLLIVKSIYSRWQCIAIYLRAMLCSDRPWYHTNVYKWADARLPPTPTTVFLLLLFQTVKPFFGFYHKSRLCHKMTKKCQDCDSGVNLWKCRRTVFMHRGFFQPRGKRAD